MKAAKATTLPPVTVQKPPAVTPLNAPVTSQPPKAKTIDQMSSEELIDACDAAAQAGDHAESNRFYREYESRKADR